MPDRTVNVITPEGVVRAIPEDTLPWVLAQDPRYRIESPSQGAARAADTGLREGSKGVLGGVRAATMSALSGASLGAFDAIGSALDGAAFTERRKLDAAEHSNLAAGGEIVGALLTAIPSGGTSVEAAVARQAGKRAAEKLVAREAGSVAAREAERGILSQAAALTPSGALSNFSARVAERGAGRGLAADVGYKALGGAIEGAGQSVGSYVSDVALGDRDLSAEGFLGAARDGAVLGGGTGAVIGVTERTLTRARDLFPSRGVTRESAEAGARLATDALDGMVRDSAELERRAQAAIGDIKAARAGDPAVQAHAARLRAEREAKAVAARMEAEARALKVQEQARAAGARADSAELRLEKARTGKPAKTPRGTPPDGVPVPISDSPLAAPALSPADEISDLERALAATNQRLGSGDSWSVLQAENRAAREVATVADDLEEAVVAIDPSAAKLRELATQTRIGREGVQDYIASLSRRADEKADRLIAAGKMRREDDVIRSLDGGRDIFGAKVGAGPARGADGRSTVSRLRTSLSDEEIIAKAERNPSFIDTADNARGSVRMTARDDLVERILSGKTPPRALEIEEVLPRVNPETGEVMAGTRLERRAATSDDILRAIEGNRRDPAYASYVSDDIMKALRGRLDLPDDLERAIPAISKLEMSEAALARELGHRAPPSSLRRAEEYAAAEASHAEAKIAAESQKMAAIEDAAGDEIARAAAAARAEDMAAVVSLPSMPVTHHAAEKASKLADIASAIEVMSTLGIPGLPSAANIPIIGPVLGLYLKARAGMTVWKKLGGKMPTTVESTVAKRAAATRDRMGAAVRSILDGSAKKIGRTPVQAASVAEVLGRSVFSEGKSKPRPKETMAQMWERHRAEIAAAKQAGALERVLRERVPTGDPVLARSLASVARRRLAYLDEKMPRPPAGPGDPDLPPWHPSAAQAAQWAAIVDATEDPAAVLERAAAGDVSADQIEAVRAVFPKLYAEAQLAIVEGIANGQSIPYARRVQLGTLFRLPLTPTEDPAFVASMQTSYSAPPPDAPTPRPSANVDIAGPAMLQEESP